MVAVLVPLLLFGAILFLFYFGAQEFQSLTAEEDADASEDDHIKAMFAEVDSNKDGKVLLLACVDVFVSAPSSLRRCLAPPANTKQKTKQKTKPKTKQWCPRSRSELSQIDFNEYLGQDATSVVAAQEEETPASAA